MAWSAMLNLLTILPAPGLSGAGAASPAGTGFADLLSRLLASSQGPSAPAGVAAARHPGAAGVATPSPVADLPQALRLTDHEASDLALLIPGAPPLQPVLDTRTGVAPGLTLAGAPSRSADRAGSAGEAAGPPPTPSVLEPAVGDPAMPEAVSSPEPASPSDRSLMPSLQGAELAPGGAAEPPGRVRPGPGRERAADPRAEALPADRPVEPAPAQTGGIRSGPAETATSNPARAAASGVLGEVAPLPPASVEPVTTDLGFEPASELADGLRAADRTSSPQESSSAAAPRAPANPAASQVEVHLTRAAQGRIDRLVVQLEPMDLGKVEIRLEFGEEGRVGAVISAERPETLEALQRDAQALERSLRDAGLRPDGGGLSFDLKRHSSDGRSDGDRPRPEPLDGAATADAGAPKEPHLRPLRLLDIQA